MSKSRRENMIAKQKAAKRERKRREQAAAEETARRKWRAENGAPNNKPAGCRMTYSHFINYSWDDEGVR